MNALKDVQLDTLKKVFMARCKNSCKEGWISPNTPCECLLRYRVARELFNSNFPIQQLKVEKEYAFQFISEEDKKTIAGFNSNIKKCVSAGLSFFFYGKNGIGKTTSAVKLAEEIMYFFNKKEEYNPYINFYFLTAFELSKCFFDDKEKFNDILSKSVLVVDDVGKEAFYSEASERARQQYWLLYDSVIRTRNMKNLTTIFTTNKTMQDLYETFSVSIKSIMGLNEEEDGSISNAGKYRFILFSGNDVRAKYESSEWDEILGTGKSQKIAPENE